MPFDRGQRAADARIIRRQESHRRQQQDAGIEHLRAIGLDEGIQFEIKSSRADVEMDGIAQRAPLVERRLEAEHLGALDAAVERDPGHYLRRHIMLACAAALPDTVIRLVPYFGKM